MTAARRQPQPRRGHLQRQGRGPHARQRPPMDGHEGVRSSSSLELQEGEGRGRTPPRDACLLGSRRSEEEHRLTTLSTLSFSFRRTRRLSCALFQPNPARTSSSAATGPFRRRRGSLSAGRGGGGKVAARRLSPPSLPLPPWPPSLPPAPEKVAHTGRGAN